MRRVLLVLLVLPALTVLVRVSATQGAPLAVTTTPTPPGLFLPLLAVPAETAPPPQP